MYLEFGTGVVSICLSGRGELDCYFPFLHTHKKIKNFTKNFSFTVWRKSNVCGYEVTVKN